VLSRSLGTMPLNSAPGAQAVKEILCKRDDKRDQSLVSLLPLKKKQKKENMVVVFFGFF